MTVVEEIIKLELTPVTEVTIPKLAGFYVKAYKRNNRKKTGFLLNSIRSLNIDQQTPKRIRTRISWSGDGENFEIEENASSTQRRGGITIHFKVPFDVESKVEIIKGKPIIEANVFKGKSIEVTWTEEVITVRSIEGRSITCKLKRKQNIIDIMVQN